MLNFFMRDWSVFNFQVVSYARPGSKVSKKGKYGPEKSLKIKFEKKVHKNYPSEEFEQINNSLLDQIGTHGQLIFEDINLVQFKVNSQDWLTM